jgi:acetyltransferase
MFIYKTKKFTLNNGSECKLVLPDLEYAEDIYKVIVEERLRLAKYLPWVLDMKSVQDEEQFLEYSIDKIHKEEMMMFIILVDENVAGMIDLHNINKSAKRAEVGYWLSENFEGYGIMTQAVAKIEKYSFKELKLHKLQIKVHPENQKSASIPQRLGYFKEATLVEHEILNGEYIDLDIFAKLNK